MKGRADSMFENKNLFWFITNEIINDDGDSDYISESLRGMYENAPKQEKEVINQVFLRLTGYYFSTLIDMYDDSVNEEQED